MSGHKIIESLKDAVAGNFDRVTISGQTWVRRDVRSMATAPRDGTHILAYLYRERDDENAAFGEWREIFYRPYEAMKGWNTPWHAGDPFDSHSCDFAPEHFGEAVPIAWLPLPPRPPLTSPVDGAAS